MSQRDVEWVVGRLVTDEGFRRRFAREPVAALRELIESGFELNGCERRALLAIAPDAVERFAEELDPRIQKSDLRGDVEC